MIQLLISLFKILILLIFYLFLIIKELITQFLIKKDLIEKYDNNNKYKIIEYTKIELKNWIRSTCYKN